MRAVFSLVVVQLCINENSCSRCQVSRSHILSGNVGIYAMMIPICNEGLASQQRPNVSAGGRSQSRIGDGAVKAQKRQTPRSEDRRLPPREMHCG